MKKILLGLFVMGLSVLSSEIQGQNSEGRAWIQKQINVEKLNQLSEEKAKEYKKNKQQAIELAKKNGWVVRKELADGSLIELQGIDANGDPIYYKTENLFAAKTVSTDKLWQNNGYGIDLTGTDMILGEWDGGAVLTSHQEFTNQGASRVIQKDNPSSTHYHATHVAGTMVAAGVNPNAKGMAPDAVLHAYDWNNDESEMLSAAAQGLLISNHSYGQYGGWEYDDGAWIWYGNTLISDEEDFKFGLYTDDSRYRDFIANNAPYYLIVQSAGNERGEGPSNGDHPVDGGAEGYDCIMNKKLAKNVLTIGAVKDVPGGYNGNPADVEMTSFSSWGPCDDGRIKPDICANGYDLLSTYDGYDTEYASISGTSMATPSASGSLLLLQELYWKTYGKYMKAATLKALAIHTADECGPDEGPDYMFGWGLLNTKSAADVIANNKVTDLILEDTYEEEEMEFSIKASGNEPLVITLVWSDATGGLPPSTLDPTFPVLVNDLDVSLVANNATYYPYMLDVANPSDAATTGNNNVDNVEKIFVANPEAGSYTIKITHEGNIVDDYQNFSLVVSGITGYPLITNTDVYNITETTAFAAVSINNQSSSTIIERGVLYGDDFAPGFDDSRIDGAGDDSTYFEVELQGLLTDHLYNLRSFVINATDTVFSPNVTFRTEHAYPYLQSFESGLGKWEQNVQDGFDWTILSGATPTGSTGPAAASDGSYYLYAESTDNTNATAIIDVPFNFTELDKPNLYFDYHMFGSSMGNLKIDIKEGESWYTDFYVIEGQQQESEEERFYQAAISLQQFAGMDSIVIRFKAETGSFFYSDIAIDKVEVGNDLYAPDIMLFSVEELGATWAKAKIKANDKGVAYFLVSDDLNLNPEVADVLAGQVVAIDKNMEHFVVFESLNRDTPYKVFAVTQDSVGNTSAISSLEFTTLVDGATFEWADIITLYPNPNDGNFYLNLSGLNFDNATLRIFDMSGKMVYQSITSDKVSTINLAENSKGIYHLQLMIDDAIYNKKFIVK